MNNAELIATARQTLTSTKRAGVFPKAIRETLTALTDALEQSEREHATVQEKLEGMRLGIWKLRETTDRTDHRNYILNDLSILSESFVHAEVEELRRERDILAKALQAVAPKQSLYPVDDWTVIREALAMIEGNKEQA